MIKMSLPVKITTAEFQKGFDAVRSQEIHRFGLGEVIDEETVVDIIRNLTEIAQEGWLTEAFLRQDAGMLVGWFVQCWNTAQSS